MIFLEPQSAICKKSFALHSAIGARPRLASTANKRLFIFYQITGRARPLILAILHEKQDLVARLSARLDEDN